MTRPRRRVTSAGLAGTLVVAIALAGLAVSPVPTAAAPNRGDALVFVSASGQGIAIERGSLGGIGSSPVGRVDRVVAGDFTGDPGTGLLLYAAGSAPDAIISIVPTDSGFAFDTESLTVTGTYTPLVGDFDGSGIDDVLWYAPGPKPDSLWRFAADGSHTSSPLRIDGTYRPTVVETDGDGIDDVLWYAPGSKPDSIWRFGAGGTHRTASVRIDGSYRIDAGRFADPDPGAPEDRLLFTPHTSDGRGSIWTFEAGGDHTSQPLGAPAVTPVIGDFHGTGRDDILWYGAGPFLEGFTTFDASGAPTFGPAPEVQGTYAPVVLDVDGDAIDDIAWTTRGRATVWTFGDALPGRPYRQRTVETGLTDAIAATTLDDR